MPLTAKQIGDLRSRLLAERARLKGDDDSVLSPIRDTQPDVGDEMDAAEMSRNQADAAARSEQERGLLAEIELALGRIDAGTYGVSELTGEPIEYARLAAVPWARFSAREQEELEREMSARRSS
jgi:DnaK suppressor protein